MKLIAEMQQVIGTEPKAATGLAPVERDDAAYGSYYLWLRAYACRQLAGRTADALDLAQETMERFLRRFPSGLPPEPYCKGWLGRTFNNLLVSEWRRQCVRQRTCSELSQMVPPPSSPAQEPTALARALDQLTDEAFLAAVSTLRPKLREAYELHLRGLSHADIANRLGLERSAVAKRLHDARKCLRVLLEPGARFRGPRFAVRTGPPDSGPAAAAATAA